MQKGSIVDVQLGFKYASDFEQVFTHYADVKLCKSRENTEFASSFIQFLLQLNRLQPRYTIWYSYDFHQASSNYVVSLKIVVQVYLNGADGFISKIVALWCI